MTLDRFYEAEAALQTAVNHFEQGGDWLNRGRTRTNLGSLYLRTGRYAAALRQFEGAARDLLGEAYTGESITPEQVRTADILLLDRASGYLALNLLAEATQGLIQCEALFRAAGQPYELGQSLLTLGLVRLRSGDEAGAQAALLEAERLFIGLQNRFWQNRTRVALAALAFQRGQLDLAASPLDRLLAQPVLESTVSAWDMGSLVEAQLLRLRIHLQRNELTAARTLAAAISATLGLPQGDPLAVASAEILLPHLVLRLYHAWGGLAQAAGEQEQAQHYYRPPWRCSNANGSRCRSKRSAWLSWMIRLRSIAIWY
jgi:tetratricopeptide (TPR) repeat protein